MKERKEWCLLWYGTSNRQTQNSAWSKLSFKKPEVPSQSDAPHNTHTHCLLCTPTQQGGLAPCRHGSQDELHYFTISQFAIWSHLLHRTVTSAQLLLLSVWHIWCHGQKTMWRAATQLFLCCTKTLGCIKFWVSSVTMEMCFIPDCNMGALWIIHTSRAQN